MEKKDWDEYTAMPEWQLMDFATEHNSQRAHAALHILAMRRNKALERIAMYSAMAAALSAVTALAQLLK
jgi:hypothetical protein